MDEEFAQTSTPLAILRGILNNYPYSVGLLREILQNSDDAKATKQTFVFDRRTHTSSSLFHSKLGATQGPALLAYNDANFEANDWVALQSAYESSKAEDSSKIGKYGVGFRSLFHITDCPQIVSGNTFAMFDPLKAFTDSPGKKLDLHATLLNSPGQLTSFSGVADLAQHPGGFNGTIIRCPLRKESSKISARVIKTQDITHLFSKFISDEIDISLLFLKHLQHIEIREIDETGNSVTLAQLSVARSPPIVYEVNKAIVLETTVRLQAGDNTKELVWRVLDCPFSREEAIKRLEKLTSGVITRTLKEHKLLPTIGLAIPLSGGTKIFNSGRLFTFLPLPLLTGFPVHVHAYLALTQSRQNLRNASEIGLVPGSDDSILIQWNKLLFTHYIPQAWTILLEVFAMDKVPSIFNAWPPEQRTSITSGENMYWQLLPSTVLDFAKASKSAIWPVYQAADENPAFDSLDRLIVVDPTQISNNVLQALVIVGLRLTCPPKYIVELIKLKDKQILILSPEQAHRGLLNHSAQLESAPKPIIEHILGYLLASNDPRCMAGLPLIHLSNNKLVALSLKETTTIRFTLLPQNEFNVFGACDDNAIALHLIPYKAAEIIKSKGPNILNVETLSVPRIVEYLTSYPNKLGLDLSLVRTDPAAVKWLSEFWSWQNTFTQKKELLPKITNFFLLPSTNGLRKADAPLFHSNNTSTVLVEAFRSLGVPFVDDRVISSAQYILSSLKLLKSINDIHAILDSLPPLVDTSIVLSANKCAALLAHLASHIPGSCSMNGSLGPERVRRLKTLPIFPIMPSTLTSVDVTYMSLPESVTIRAIENPTFVPKIPDTVFVQSSMHVLKVVEFLQSSSAKFSEVDLLGLTVDNFLSQSDHVHAAVLSKVVTLRQHIPPLILEILQKTSFVAVQDGSRKQPKQVVDPASAVALLYTGDSGQIPRNSIPSDSVVISSLQQLKLMRHTLSIEIIQERITTIASEPTSAASMSLANDLLTLMSKTLLDYSRLSVSSEQQWLPTSNGLRSSAQCRDTEQSSRHLFDKVLAVLDSSHRLPSSLRIALGWDQPLPLKVLIEQFNLVLDGSGDTFAAVLEILKELASRESSSLVVESLRQVTANRNWVPTSDGYFSDVSSAVFSPPIPDSGFFQICPVDRKTRDLLRQMGCSDKPTTSAILFKLQLLGRRQVFSLSTTTTALNALRSLPSKITNEDRSQLLIPDVNDVLRPFSRILFNDIGNHASLVPSENDFICHPLLDERLAGKLLVGRLGLKYGELGTPDIEMGEKLVITVRKTLTQYSDKQFVTEFLANAADANASKFNLIVNDAPLRTMAPPRALSPEMAKFCTSPSIVVHNNAMFSDEDFVGICRTSVGGKYGKRETIGQFGLGALTMFHFTELAIIVSNNRVLFLNPSKAHLPLSDQAVLFLPLNHVRNYYPSHLGQINGLFGFQIESSEPYIGTIFLLPLRQEEHCEGSADFISRTLWNPEKAKIHVLDLLEESACNSLIYTKLSCISGRAINSRGHEKQSWAYSSQRLDIGGEVDSGYSLTDVCISSRGSVTIWKVANATVPENQIPADMVSLLNERRLRFPPIAGLAVLTDDPAKKDMEFKFFSTLPLGISNSLPLHVNASFILASDRRQIRLDDYNGAETRYNKWLLSDILPPLYYFLLGSVLQLGSKIDNKRWWPRNVSNDDSYSRIIVESFYTSRLKTCGRKLFRSLYTPTELISPQHVVLTPHVNESSSITNVLEALAPTQVASTGSKGVYHFATERAELATVNPEFLSREILRDPVAIHQLGIKVVEDVFRYLSKTKENEPPVHLYGLQILPLDDDSFGTIADLQTNPEGLQYFVWTPRIPIASHNFPPNRFVHRGFKVSHLEKMHINVKLLDVNAMKNFIEQCLDAASPFETLPTRICTWIAQFWASWEEYASLGLQHEDILDLTLVPTTQPNTYVALEQCRNGTALILGGNTEEEHLLRTALHQLGLAIVRIDQEPTPRALCEIFQAHRDCYPSLNFERLLSALSLLLLEKFDSLETELQEALAIWARRNMGQSAIPDDLIDLANKLPIWPSLKKGLVLKLRAAEDVSMLPNGLDLVTTGRFMGELVAGYNSQLGSLVTLTLTAEQVGDILDLPTKMDDSELRDYATFLRTWLVQIRDNRVISLPNTNHLVAQSDQLYARDPFFIAAFGENASHFVARELNEIEHLFYRHQLRRKEQLDVRMFRTCAEALHDVEDGNMVARAAILFNAYCIDLPMYVPSNDAEAWRELDELRFVPRSLTMERRLEGQDANAMGINIPLNVTALPPVVAPFNLVLKQFEAVAWTQRAFFDEQPHQRILLAYPGLGRPDVSDVVKHLQALSNMYCENTQQRRILLHDLKETYNFIANNIGIAHQDDLTQLINGDLFLNIDDPDTNEEWIWDDCAHLVFETHDTEGSFRHVRQFLQPFSTLLRHLGVLEVYHPQYTSEHSKTSDVSKLETIRQGFDSLRKDNHLIDVVFVVDEEGELPEPLSPLVAHRAFLAVISDHFRHSFCGGYTESRPGASLQDPVKVKVPGYSRECVQSVLDYIYTGIQSLDSAPLESLLQILQLSGLWNVRDLFEDVQKQIIIRKMIAPSTLESIKDAARVSVAEDLTRACEEYEERNATFILRVQQSMEGDFSAQDGDGGE